MQQPSIQRAELRDRLVHGGRPIARAPAGIGIRWPTYS